MINYIIIWINFLVCCANGGLFLFEDCRELSFHENSANFCSANYAKYNKSPQIITDD